MPITELQVLKLMKGRSTAMGMAASQARFLGLTARKTNVEFEGQQINQQRTTLSNQSANYYNDLLGMSVPVPPSVDDYTKTVYTFEDGALQNQITAMIAQTDGTYTVSYTRQWKDDFAVVSAATSIVTKNNQNGSFSIGSSTLRELANEDWLQGFLEWNYTDDSTGEVTDYALEYIGNDEGITFGADGRPDNLDDIYDPDTLKNYNTQTFDNAYGAYQTGLYRYAVGGGNYEYFYITNDNGKLLFNQAVWREQGDGTSDYNHWTLFASVTGNTEDMFSWHPTQHPVTGETATEEQVAGILEEEQQYIQLLNQKYGQGTWMVRYVLDSTTGESVPYFYKLEDLQNAQYDSNGHSQSSINCYTIGTETKTEEVKAVEGCMIEKDSSGRYINITIPNDGNPITYALTTSTVTDQAAYEDAMNQYEFDKNEYDQAINDINAKIEIVQSQDKNLELRLKQLDTEQDAIQTEMDAVTKVIEKNTESTFKTFG